MGAFFSRSRPGRFPVISTGGVSSSLLRLGGSIMFRLTSCLAVLVLVGVGQARGAEYCEATGHWYEVVAVPLTELDALKELYPDDFPLEGDPMEGDVRGIPWSVAQKKAKERGGYLARIGSQAENLFVYDLISNPDNIMDDDCPDDTPKYWFRPRHMNWDWSPHLYGPWIGGEQKQVVVEPDPEPQWVEPDGGWSWAKTDPDDANELPEPWVYENWSPGEPNNGPNVALGIFNEDKLHFHAFNAPADTPSPIWNDFPNYFNDGRDLGYGPQTPIAYIVEYDTDPDVVPEPSTLALLFIGVVGLLAYALRKRRRR